MSYLGPYHFCYAAEPVTLGKVSCQAKWNEFCEDKKILSLPLDHHLCRYEIQVIEKTGESDYQIVSQDEKSITLYFKAKGNQDRFNQKPASILLSVSLFGVKTGKSCNDNSPATEAQVAVKPVTPDQNTPAPDASNTTGELASQPAIPAIVPTPVLEKPPILPSPPTETPPINAAKLPPLNACACSPWSNWAEVNNCLAKGKGKDGVSCDSYEASIQCVSSKEECRLVQKENCPQALGLNQSTSLKRLFVENSPYCQQ